MKQSTWIHHAAPAVPAARPTPLGPKPMQPRPRPPRSDEQRSLREQLERAARVQKSLLPDVSGPIGDYRLASLHCPCETLAGDFYDLIHRPDCAILLVADVMGHGVEAALITMLVKAVFQETAETAVEPEKILAQMNLRLNRITPDGVFAAAAVVRIRPGRSAVSLANAGLPYPFVLRRSPRRVEEVPLGGFPLGLFNGSACSTYRQCSVTLDRGDVLLLASDGIGAVEGDGERYFDERRLRRALARLAGCPGRELIDSLVGEALEFSHGRPLPDDINLVTISRQGPAQERSAALP